MTAEHGWSAVHSVGAIKKLSGWVSSSVLLAASLLLHHSSVHAQATLGLENQSPTMQRLGQHRRQMANKEAAENAKWIRFPRPGSVDKPLDIAGVVMMNLMLDSPVSSCEFYWPGWKKLADGSRVTRVRGCRNSWVAVNCAALRISWGYQPLWPVIVNGVRTPSPVVWGRWETPDVAALGGGPSALMMAELCDNLVPSIARSVFGSPLNSSAGTSSSLPAQAAKRLSRQGELSEGVVVNLGVEGQRIYGLLEQIGVSAILTKKCPRAGAIAAYSRSENLLVLCKEALRDPSLTTEAVAHEAVHALQDCVQPGGITGASSIPLTVFFGYFNGGKSLERFKNLVAAGLRGRESTMAHLEAEKNRLSSEMLLMEHEASALEIWPERVYALLKNIGLSRCKAAG